ncbi:MAG: tetratricopeptide repeat protein [Spirochaetaceae bacterium]|jgi:tetratricopeptide (TPR) repeat protein|nr:tetratricopeptide repeat protein [Spirochaetaceae bacterium]
MQTEEKLSFKERLADFVQKKQRLFFIATMVCAVALIGIIVGVIIHNAFVNKAFITLDAYTSRYEALRFDITDPEQEAAVTTLLDEITAFAKSHIGYAGARAYTIIATMQADRKNWADAESAWMAAAQAAGSKTYLKPVALYNAAVAAEEQNKPEQAIDLYTQILSYAHSFPAVARAAFAVGRLNEARNNTDAAIQAYQNIIENYTNETVWVNLAHNRLIALGQ